MGGCKFISNILHCFEDNAHIYFTYFKAKTKLDTFDFVWIPNSEDKKGSRDKGHKKEESLL